MNLVGGVLSFRHWFQPFSQPVSSQSSDFKAVWIARLCFVLNVLCFLGVMVLIIGGVLEGLSEDDSLLVAMILYMFGLIGLIPYFFSMTLLWSWFLGKQFKVTLRVMLLGIGLYVVTLCSVYQLLIGIAL